MKIGRLFVALLTVFCWTSLAQAQVDLFTVLSNPGFEDDNPGDTVHNGWTVTLPNGNFKSDACETNPVIYPNDPLEAPGFPLNLNFIGVVNAGDLNIACKLVHNATANPGSWPTGTVFNVEVCATRGHLLPDPPTTAADDPFDFCKNVTFGTPCPEVNVQFFVWKAGGTPTINSSDNWSRTPTQKSASLPFTAWDPVAGQWACQKFTFTYTNPLVGKFVSVSVSGLNHRHDTYVAFDIVEDP
jgi:hypothetical protein